MMNSRLQVAFVAMLLFLLCWYSKAGLPGWRDDYILYLHQAKALQEGSIINLVHRQQWLLAYTPYDISPVVYPWGVPIMLWMLQSVSWFAGNEGWWLNTFWMVLALTVGFLSWRKKTGSVPAFLVAAIILMHPAMAISRNETGSDAIGWCVQLLVCLGWIGSAKGYFANRPFAWALLGGVLMAFAITIRLPLMSLLPVFLLAILTLLPNRKTKSKGVLIFSATTILLLLPVLLLLPLPVYPETLQSNLWLQPGHWFSQLKYCLRIVWSEILLVPGTHGVAMLLLIPIAIGCWQGFRHLKWLLLAFLLHLLLQLASPYPPNGRYLILAVPILVVAAALGLQQILIWVNQLSLHWQKSILVSVLFGTLSATMVITTRFIGRKDQLNLAFGPQSASFLAMVKMLELSLPDTVAINFAKPRTLQYLLPNPVFYHPDTTSDKTLQPVVVLFRPELKVMSYPDGYLSSFNHPGQWHLLYQDSNFLVFAPALVQPWVN